MGEGVGDAMGGPVWSAVAVVLGGTIIGAVTGITLAWLLQHPSNKAKLAITAPDASGGIAK